jgi:hypothetical protein
MAATGDEVVAADLTAITDLTVSRPLVRMVQTVGQSIADATITALTFTTEEIDTHGFHDNATNNTRITPNVAGYYDVRGTYFMSTSTSPVSQDCHLRQNGSGSIAPGERGISGTIAQSQPTRALLAFNGSTDYVELMAFQDSAGANTSNVSSRFSSVFEAIFERSL